MLSVTLPTGADRGVAPIGQPPRLAEYRVTATRIEYRYLDQESYGHWTRRIVTDVAPVMAPYWFDPDGPEQPSNIYYCL
jgi:hypothetical protein